MNENVAKIGAAHFGMESHLFLEVGFVSAAPEEIYEPPPNFTNDHAGSMTL